MRPRRSRADGHAGIHFAIAAADPNNHLFQVTLTIATPAPKQTLRLPVWIPGSYLIREFSKNLQGLRCHQNGRNVPVVQHDKASWGVECAEGESLQVLYDVYAFDNSVRTAWLDAQRGFFNATSMCLMVEGQTSQPHTLHLTPHETQASWDVATGLTALQVDKKGWGLYRADDYNMLADCPVEMGPFWSGSFEACGIAHRFVVAGSTETFDAEQLLTDTKAICEAEIMFWKGTSRRDVPFQNYTFMLNAVHDGYGGLEHRNSTALICTRKDLPRKARNTLAPTVHKQPEGYTTLLGLISHEYFHTWNVKRLRPAEFSRYDYAAENYTALLWFFEGFTSYYDDLILRRSRRIDNATYLKLLSKTINQVQQTPGRLVQSVAEASFDAWVKYYRQDENTANATVSYYTKGSLVALCLDLTLRSDGNTTLDAVMRGLWARCAGGPMTEVDLLVVLQQLGSRSYAKEVARWVHGTGELPLAELLEQHGVQFNREPDQVAQQLGMRVKDSGGLHITQVMRGGAAEKAGFAAGDEWLTVQALTIKPSGPWRMQALDDLMLYCGNARKVIATVARDKRVLSLTLNLPKASFAARLSVRDIAAVSRWLDQPPATGEKP
jgi:predicted metalloprotease with PDZ domain